MASRVEGNDGVWDVAIMEAAANCSLFLQPNVQAVLSAGQGLHQAMPFAELAVDAADYPATLKILFKDRRVWTQTIETAEPDPRMSFTATATWRQSELDQIRPLRDACVTVLFSHGVTLITLKPALPEAANAVG